MFYTYAHSKPDDTIFYIGKGQRRRAWAKDNRNQHWLNIVAKHGQPKVQILAKWKTEQEATEHEKFLILCFRDMGYKLANVTSGGEGISGYKHTPETIKLLTEHHKKLQNLPEQKLKTSIRSKLQMQNIEFREKVRSAALAHMALPENRERSRQGAILQNSSLEFRQKQRERAIQRMKQSKYRLLMAKPCMCVETGQIFQSQAEAAKWIGKNARPQSISRSVCGKRKTAYGYHWKSVDKE